MKKLKKCLAAFLAMTLVLSGFLGAPASRLEANAQGEGEELINLNTVWKYLDNNSDPAGTGERTSWTLEGYDDSTWKTNGSTVARFGAKNGAIADLGNNNIPTVLLNQYISGTSDIPAFFFRTSFTLDSIPENMELAGTLKYDDAVIVYLNGTRIAAFDEPAGGFGSNLSYGGSNAGTPIEVNFTAETDALKAGENVLAVELHQGRESSSDIYFEMSSLKLQEKVGAQPDALIQKAVSLTVGADASSRNLTWYVNSEAAGKVQYAPKSGDTFPETCSEAEATAAAANDSGFYSNQAVLTGLAANTEYVYRLVNGETVSDVYSFKTGGTDSFSFLLAGDPQIGASGNVSSDTNGWEDTLNKAAAAFPDASFLISAGDQVNTANNEAQYAGYLEHSVLTGLPVGTVVGNHDSGSNSYSQHFNNPNVTAYGASAAGSDYWYVYNNVLFMNLNSNNLSTAEHKAFMKEAIDANKNVDWKVVVFHHSIFSVANHASESDILQRRNDLVPVFKELDVDVVLMGHDHVYVRSYMMDGLTAEVTDTVESTVTDPDGILYVTVNSASGSKFYNIKSETFDYAAVQSQEKIPNISNVEVTENSFKITTYRTSDMSEVDSFTILRSAEEKNDSLLIDQVYGGGGKGETPVSNSFIELYNPGSADVDLTGYSLVNGDKTLELSGTIPAKGSYLIVGAAESTSDEYLTYDLPEADMDCDWTIDNKSYTIRLMNGETEIDSVTAGTSAETKISKQKSLKRNDHGEFGLVVWEKESVTVDDAYVAANAPRNSKGQYGSVHTIASEPSYTPVVTDNVRVKGYYNESGSLNLELGGRYNSDAMNGDGGSLEIVTYNSANGYAYAVSGIKGKLIAVDLNGGLSGETAVALSGTEYDVKSMMKEFPYGDMTSVAVSPDGSRLAVAVQAENYADAGAVALFSCREDGSLELLSCVRVGVQPDMLTFADANTILTADEGEPREGVNGSDPKGSVTVVTIGSEDTLTANFVYFDSFDAKRESLVGAGVLVQKNTLPSTDFEPEYIAVSGGTAYVSLQEANAIAVLDIASGSFTGVYPLGFQDYGTTKVDLQKNGITELKTYENVLGIKMPDGISVTSIGGKIYLLTANEGDSRADWAGLDNEYEGKISPTGNVALDEKVVWFNADMWDGLDSEKDYVFGGRSFSIYEVTGNGLELVYDSGSGFEEITAEVLPEYFNTSNDKITLDNRSGKKGPEPESVVTGNVNGRIFAFIALERIGGVMVYDITDPGNTVFVNYINSREFAAEIQGDVSPEGLCFIPAQSNVNEKPLLLAACEVSGTLAVYECDFRQSDVTPEETDPSEETDPTEDTKPTTAAEPTQASGNSASGNKPAANNPGTVSGGKGPNTGDNSQTALWLGLLAAAGAAAAGAVFVGMKKKARKR
ncbi:choice-of-anchor I family protein [Fusibacillus kribbianus]|uniref:Choice-of-anchor I family protein n=1 Tax=Fusibacillus kribbianus TaxID=3044208 RepID=A0AAP4BAX5_9FIRM|nr:choice-of-anchor I family protein [Ruminococcus sp. YH-rum2234]MDI9242924.1 choice-of-anchor I family protein [Ruminococcus sp. YH-rum2234]